MAQLVPISTRASASTSVLPMNIQDWFLLGLTGLISYPRDSEESFSAPQFKIMHSLMLCLLYGPALRSVHDYWKDPAMTIQTFVSKVMPLLFNTLSKFVIAFLPRSNHLLVLWLQAPSAVILDPKKRKSVIVSNFSPSICHEVMGPDVIILVFFNWVLSQFFHSPSSLSSRHSLVSLCFLPLEWYCLHV